MTGWIQKLRMRLPALLLLAATLLFWGRYDLYEPAGPVLLQSPELDTASRINGDCSAAEGRYVLTVEPGGTPASLNFTVPGGTEYRYLRVSGRIKVTGVVVGRLPWLCARLVLIQYDESGKWIPRSHRVVTENGTHDWTAHENVFEMDERAVRVDLMIQQTGSEGSAEFDQLIVDPVRLRPSFRIWQILFVMLWIVMAALYFHRCRLHSRRLHILIVLNAVAIIAGTLIPEQWIDTTADFSKEQAERIVEASSRKPVTNTVVQQPRATSEASPTRDAQQRLEQRFNYVDMVIGKLHGIGHFVLFASLCFLLYLSAALERQPRIYYAKVAFDMLLFAAITESLQHLTLDRTPGLSDWMVDVAGMLTALVLFLPLGLWLLLRRTGNAESEVT